MTYEDIHKPKLPPISERVCEVDFINEPLQSEHAADQNFNEKRKSLVPLVKEFIARHALFEGKRVSVTFFTHNKSSLVSVLDTGEQKFILKIPLIPMDSGLEGVFLKAWEDVGVTVPHIFEQGEIGGQQFMLMEYIHAPTVSKSGTNEELIRDGMYVQMGEALRQMHDAAATGYGEVIEGKSQFQTILEWLDNDARTQKKIAYIKENNLLNDEEHGSLEQVRDILVSRINDNPNTVYCHNDFHIGNVFATEPLTVFDPFPSLNHPYMDVGRTILIAVKMGLEDVHAQVTEGYFGHDAYDPQLMQAFMVLNAYSKFMYWHQTKRDEGIRQAQEFLAKRKYLLDSAS